VMTRTMGSSKIPEVGQIVQVTQGRDSGKYAVVIGVEDRFVYIVDGDKRKFDRPKKKNLLHVRLLNEVAREVADSIRETGRVTNGKLRFVLSRYANESEEAQEKGE
jgi:Ribosomal protein L14E/L6E/L27E